jgi:hypothetical protein
MNGVIFYVWLVSKIIKKLVFLLMEFALVLAWMKVRDR